MGNMSTVKASGNTGNTINYEEEIKKCKTQDDLFGENGLLKKLIKDAIEKMMEAEIEEYMGRKKYERTDTDEPEYRNGYRKKTVKSSVGEFDVNIPRDRQSGFKPIIIENYQSTCGEFDKKIIGMYAKGMTVRDIQAQIREIYGVEVSPDFISMVTDKVMTNVADWQNRLLDKVYPIVYMDAMHFKVRDDGRVVNRAAYICLGINKEGMKDILGIWIGESEGAKFWLGVCNELKVRGVQDILLACVDGLKGFPEAIKSVFPNGEALKKSLYLGTMDILKKWTMPVANWGQVVAQFAILFEGRLELGL